MGIIHTQEGPGDDDDWWDIEVDGHKGGGDQSALNDWVTWAVKGYGANLKASALLAGTLGIELGLIGGWGAYNAFDGMMAPVAPWWAGPAAVGLGWLYAATLWELGTAAVLNWAGDQLMMEPPRWDCWASSRPPSPYLKERCYDGAMPPARQYLKVRLLQMAEYGLRALECVEKAAAAREAGDGATADFLTGQAAGWLKLGRRAHREFMGEMATLPWDRLQALSEDQLFEQLQASSRAAGETFHPRLIREWAGRIHRGLRGDPIDGIPFVSRTGATGRG